jgi:hypothetical protein
MDASSDSTASVETETASSATTKALLLTNAAIVLSFVWNPCCKQRYPLAGQRGEVR